MLTDLERFWSRVDKSAGPDACWLWTAGVHVRGYGRIRWNKEPENAHRVSWMIAYGPVPDNLHVLHRCDNRLCCNPSHLFLGTHAENMLDRDRKGRGYVEQESNGRFKKAKEKELSARSLPSDLKKEIEYLRAEIDRLNALVLELQSK